MLLAPLILGLAACGGTRPPCSCFVGQPLASRAEAAAAVGAVAAVFEGTVVRTVYRDPPRPAASESSHTVRLPELEVTVAVSRRWKGELADTVTLRTPAATEACGADFAEGRTYLVFAWSRDYTGIGVAPPARAGEVVYTTKCSLTTAVGREAQRIAALLGRPLPPRSAAGRPSVPDA